MDPGRSADSVVVPFAFLAAQTLPDLKAAAQRAIQQWIIVRDLNYTKDITPHQFTLFQNYPNPFNSGTTIRYTIDHHDLVTLKVFDILGREIETLVDDILSPNSYHVVFPRTKTLASGVYFYRLMSGGKTQVNKMVYIR